MRLSSACSYAEQCARSAERGRYRINQAYMVIMSPVFGVFLLISMAVVIPTNNGQRLCTINSECPSNQCCLLGPSRYAIPNCAPFQQKDEQCRINANTFTNNLTYPDNSQLEVRDIHLIICPCADGLSCNTIGICQ